MAHSTLNRIRSAFTLIELLVVMTIIAILVALIVPAVMSAYRRAESFAIEQEVLQLEAAMDAFKTKYGFYPPDFTQFSGGITAKSNAFIPYLNRIAPNHGELAQANGWPVGTRRVDVWMTQVGQYLGPDSAFVFWLSGLTKDKQYPLTYLTTVIPGGLVSAQPAYNGGPVGTVEREIFFDFKNERMLIDATTVPTNMISRFTQTVGRYEPYCIFELASLATYPPVPGCAVGSITVTPYEDAAGVLINKESFQVLAPGVDGIYSTNATTTLLTPNATKHERDNITNFAEGRLERVMLN